MLAGDDVTEAALTQASQRIVGETGRNKMTDYYVGGDVHGKAGMLEDLLKTWDGQTQLLFLGDLIDRGEDSRRVLEMVQELSGQSGLSVYQKPRVYVLTWLGDPEESYDHYRPMVG